MTFNVFRIWIGANICPHMGAIHGKIKQKKTRNAELVSLICVLVINFSFISFSNSNKNYVSYVKTCSFENVCITSFHSNSSKLSFIVKNSIQIQFPFIIFVLRKDITKWIQVRQTFSFHFISLEAHLSVEFSKISNNNSSR